MSKSLNDLPSSTMTLHRRVKSDWGKPETVNVRIAPARTVFGTGGKRKPKPAKRQSRGKVRQVSYDSIIR